MKKLNSMIAVTSVAILGLGSSFFINNKAHVNYSIDSLELSQNTQSNNLYSQYQPLINILNAVSEANHQKPYIQISRQSHQAEDSYYFLYHYPNIEQEALMVFGNEENNMASILVGFMESQMDEYAVNQVQQNNTNGIFSYNKSMGDAIKTVAQATSIALFAKMAADNPEHRNYYQNISYENIVGSSAKNSLISDYNTPFMNFINLNHTQEYFFSDQMLATLKNKSVKNVVEDSINYINTEKLSVTLDDERLVKVAIKQLNGNNDNQVNDFNNSTIQAMKNSIIKNLYDIERQTSSNVFIFNIQNIPEEELKKFTKHYPLEGKILTEAYNNQPKTKTISSKIQEKNKTVNTEDKAVKDIFDLPEPLSQPRKSPTI